MSKSSPKPILEVCVDTLAAAKAAYEGGAHRLEVCGDLSIGGITPSKSLVQDIQLMCDLPLAVMVRPRGGDFAYTGQELAQMLDDIAMAKELGVEAVVLGVLDKKGQLDTANLRRLIEAAMPLDIVFHRAFDECADPLATFDLLIDLGVDRLLTSGQQITAEKGIELLKELVLRADGQITVMPGAGIMPANIGFIAEQVQASCYHGSCRGALGSTDSAVVADIVRKLM